MKRLGRLLCRVLPKGLKARIDRSAFRRARAKRARKLASGSKRLDLCAAQVAHFLHLAGLSGTLPVCGKRCLELGSGWVLSHALVLHLLGAEKVVATDVARNAYPPVLRRSVHESRPSMVRDMLAPFEEHSAVRARFDRLLEIEEFSFEALAELGIEYVAPIDLAQRRLGSKSDWVFSFSVLEHVPVEDVGAVLGNLAAELRDGGRMIHCVHLEDHRGPRRTPFEFLGEPAETFTREVQADRGNRLRRSQWGEILSRVKGMEFRFLYEWSRRDKPLPPAIDRSIRYVDEEDLRVSHFGVLGTKGKKTQ